MTKTVSEIRTILKARYEYFLRLSIYLKSIVSREVDIEEAREFISDVIGIDKINEKDIYEVLLPELETVIKFKHKEYQQYVKCLSIDDQKVGVGTLSILVRAAVKAGQFLQMIAKDKRFDYISKAQAAWHNMPLLTELINLLQPHRPEEQELLEKCIYSITKRSVSNGGKTYNMSSTGFIVKWKNGVAFNKQALMELYKFMLEDMERYEKIPKFEETVRKIKNDFEKDALLIQSLEQILEASKEVKYNEETSSFPIMNHVEYFYRKLLPFLSLVERVQTLQSEMSIYQRQLKLLKRRRDAYTKEFRRVHESHCSHMIELTKQLKNLHNIDLSKINKQILDAPYQSSIEELKNELQRISDIWANDFDLNMSNADELNAFHEYVMICLTKVKSEMTALSESISQYKSELIKIQQENLRQIDAAKQQSQALEKERIQKFHAERQQALEQYKAIVSDKRKLKKTVAKVKSIEKSEPEKNIKLHIPANQKLHIQSLSNKNRDLLHAILLAKPGLKYHQVASLITNQLSGSIEEIGNGSSHKRIRLASLTAEFYTCATVPDSNDNSENTSSTSTTVTGGFFKPHGHMHNSGMLSRFNRLLLQSIFKRAGYCIELLEEEVDMQNPTGLSPDESTQINP